MRPLNAAGVLILLTGIVIVAVTVSRFLSLRANPSLAWAVRISLVLLLAAQFVGLLMIVNGGNTFGQAGAMKVPHALALHAPQVLPVLAWLLLFTDSSEIRRTQIVTMGAVGYIVLIAVSAFQAFSGLALLDMSLSAASLLGVSLALLGAAYASVFIGLRAAVVHNTGARPDI